MMRHAWLIITHNEFEILQMLVSALDAPNSDIFIHVDKKVREMPSINVMNDNLNFLENRVDVRWGSVSQIKCEMALLEEAIKYGPYDYYHIISGTTLPLVPYETLCSFFNDQNGKSVLTWFGKDDPYQEKLKVRRYNLFLHNYSAKGVKGRCNQLLWKSAIALQKILGIEHNKGIEFYKASNWLSLTQEASEYILSQKKYIFKTFRYSFCGDEYFIPTELMASPLNEKIVNYDYYLKFKIDRSTSDVLHVADLPIIRSSGFLFARKFTAK